MSTVTTNEFKNGLKVMLDDAPCTLTDVEFVKPGKGQAFYKVRYRNLLTGRMLDRTFRSGETVESADVVDSDMQYLYHDGESWHFMDPQTYHQYAAGDAAVGDAAQWIKEEDVCSVTLWNNAPISVTPPNFVELTVTETDPGLKGDTSSGGTKAATLETGAVVKVPLFIQIDEVIKVDTRTGAYVSRA